MPEMRATILTADVFQAMEDLRQASVKLPWKKIAVIGERTVARNFRDQGRPSKWAPRASAAAAQDPTKKRAWIDERVAGARKGTKAARRKELNRFQSRASGQLLRDTGALQKSVHAEILRDNVKISSQHPLAAIHQNGTGTHGPKKRAYLVKPKAKKALRFIASDGSIGFSKGHQHPGVPARPFMGWQEQDAADIQTMLVAHLEAALAAKAARAAQRETGGQP